jgi:hypothetical protein
MIIKELINPKPKAIVIFIVFSLLFFLTPLLRNGFLETFSIEHISPIILFIVSLLIVPAHAIGLNNLIYENNIIKKENIIISFIFVLLNSFYLTSINNLICSFFLLFVINFLFTTYQKENPFYEVFNACLILGILTYVNPLMIFYLGLIIYTAIIFNYISWRILFVGFLAYIIPFILHFLFCIISDNVFTFPEIESTINLITIKSIEKFHTHEILFLASLGVTSLLSLYEFIAWVYKKSIRSRKSFFVLTFYMLISGLIYIYIDKQSWYLMLTPSCIFISNYFTYTKHKLIANITFTVLLISSCCYRYLIII